MTIKDLIKDVDLSVSVKRGYNLEAIKVELDSMQTTCIGILDYQDNSSTDMYKDMTDVLSGVDFIASELCISMDGEKIESKLVEPESFKVLVLNTSHYTFKDNDALEELATDSDMMMSRQYGFYIKLYNEAELNDKPCLSDECRYILRWALENGYRAVEFDCDGDEYEDLFTKFEW